MLAYDTHTWMRVLTHMCAPKHTHTHTHLCPCCDKTPDRNDCRREGFILVHSRLLQSIRMRKPWQDHETTHSVSTGRERTAITAGAQFTLPVVYI